MKKTYFIFLAAAIYSLGTASNITAFDYEICQCFSDGSCENCELYPIITPEKPEKGESIIDPYFNTEITRITDKAIDGYVGDRFGITLFYPTFSHENADGTYVLFNDHTGTPWYLYDAQALEKIKQLSKPDSSYSDIRWDADDPYVLYFTKYMQFYKYDVITEQLTVVRDFSSDFPNGYKITWDYEGEPSLDTRYWAFKVSGKKPDPENPNKTIWWTEAIFCYDKYTYTIVGFMPRENIAWGVEWASMSPKGDYVLVRCESCGGKIYAYNRDNFTDSHLVAKGAGHTDRAIDANGNDVVVYFSDTGGNDWLCMADVETGNETKLINWRPYMGTTTLGSHVSANHFERPGWALISVNTDHQDAQSWVDNSLLMVELTENPRVWRVAHHRSIIDYYIGNDGEKHYYYWSDPFGSANIKGTRIYFGSNWNTDVTQMEVYKIDLPENWWTDLSGPPDTTPPSAPTGLRVE